MLTKINRAANEIMARYCEADLALKTKLMTKLGERCQASENPNVRAFGNGIFIGMPEGTRIGKATPAFYRKYADCVFPSVWTARDFIATWPRDPSDYVDVADYLEAALDYQAK